MASNKKSDMQILISKLKTRTGSRNTNFLCNGYVTEPTFIFASP